ncbi:hypothetical protein OG711_38420 (plasmid) [Streptomyces uncialis]|uniref:hypothetical protein n=1 Tax=Streptomyces uncialis TaxID=1048205 RepID=UPI002E31CB40|nr:hypothetical protein [Streptomyces uncialis]
MSGRGRRASLPPADHVRPEPLAVDGLVVRHYNKRNQAKVYDFSALPVAESMQHSLAVLFAARCVPGHWSRHSSSKANWERLSRFATFVSKQESPPRDLDELTGALVKRWRTSLGGTMGDYNTYASTIGLLLDDERLQSGPVADELAKRIKVPKSGTQSYSEAEFDLVKAAARRTFRAALLRIGENARHLERWRAGVFAEGSLDWLLGEGLDLLARTGDLPRYTEKSGRQSTILSRYERAFGGVGAKATWQRLFLTRLEAAALGVLLMAEYGWNLSVIDHARVPRATPDPGEDGHPTYRIPVQKHRRGGGYSFETRNVTDDGAASRGRLITQALEATRFARGAVAARSPGTDLLVVWRGHMERPHSDRDRQANVGPFGFGVNKSSAQHWARAEGFDSSPFRRGRRTVTAVDRREPAQHSQATHDSKYALVDRRVQADAVETIAAGAEDAADRARAAVLVAELRDEPTPGDVETATADCRDFDDSPYPAPDGGCGASFLMCLGCENAHVHPGHHPRLVHLHASLASLRSILPTKTWADDWGEPYDRLEDLKRKVGDGVWEQALDRVTDADRTLINSLLTGELDQ